MSSAEREERRGERWRGVCGEYEGRRGEGRPEREEEERGGERRRS